jgi:hypothetical protein
MLVLIVAILIYAVIVSNIIAAKAGSDILDVENVGFFRTTNILIALVGLTTSFFVSAFSFDKRPTVGRDETGVKRLGDAFDK